MFTRRRRFLVYYISISVGEPWKLRRKTRQRGIFPSLGLRPLAAGWDADAAAAQNVLHKKLKEGCFFFLFFLKFEWEVR